MSQMDFAELLPTFIISEIFSHFATRDLVELRSVSKRWYLQASYIVTRELTYWPGSDEAKYLLPLCHNFGEFVTRLDLLRLPPITTKINDKFTGIITTNCKNIRALKIKVVNCKKTAEFILALGKTQRNLKHLTLEDHARKDFLFSIAPVARNLESFESMEIHLDIESLEAMVSALECPKVKILTISSKKPCDADILNLVRPKFPSLELLNFKNFGTSRGLSYLSMRFNPDFIRSSGIVGPNDNVFSFEFINSMEKLSLNNQLILIKYLAYDYSSLRGFIRSSCPVRKIELDLESPRDVEELKNIIPLLANATLLRISTLKEFTFPMHLEFSYLEVLSIQLSKLFTGPVIEWIASCFPALKELHINFITKARSPHAKLLSFPSLVSLYTNYCQPLEFWKLFISSSPNLRVVYPCRSDPKFSHFKESFKPIQVLSCAKVVRLKDAFDLSGYKLDSVRVLSLTN